MCVSRVTDYVCVNDRRVGVQEWRVLGRKFFLGVWPPPSLVDYDVFLRLLDRYLLHVNTGRNLIVAD